MSFRDKIKTIISSELNYFNRDHHGLTLKLDSVTEPSVANVQSRHTMTEAKANRLIRTNRAHRFKFSGKLVYEGPRYEWYNRCIAWKRVNWHNEVEAVTEMVEALAGYDAIRCSCELSAIGDDRVTWLSQENLKHSAGVDIEYKFEFNMTQVIDRDYMHCGAEYESEFRNYAIELFRKPRSRARSVHRSLSWIPNEISQREHDTARGRPSNRNLYQYVMDNLPYHRPMACYIKGKAVPENDTHVNEEAKFGEHGQEYPEYETEGSPNTTMEEILHSTTLEQLLAP